MKRKMRTFFLGAPGLVLLALLIYGGFWFFNENRLGVYNISPDGKTIHYGDRVYKAAGPVTNEGIMGKTIGKGDYKGNRFYVYEKKGVGPSKSVILKQNTDLAVGEEYKSDG